MVTEVEIFTGFLDSGKTRLIQDAMKSPDYMNYDTTILLVLEEGEEEYDDELLKEHGVIKYVVDEEEKLNETFLEGLEINYRPDHIMIEYNGTWDLDRFLNMRLPAGWEITAILSTVDATTAESYLMNMRNLFLAPLLASDLVIVNRTQEDTDRAKIRRAIKVMNPRVQIVFEKEDGNPAPDVKDELPFDIQAPLIELESIDYGIWYLDANEHPEQYHGKKIRFLAQVYKSGRLGSHAFVPGRFVMTCCEEDIQFLGYYCKCPKPVLYDQRDWVFVTVTFRYEYLKQYKGKGPVLYLEEILPAAKPSHNVVTFN